MNLIEVKDLNFSYENTKVLEDINFTIEKNDFIALIGNNGSGKSTLLKLLIGELKNFNGNINIFGTDIRKFNDWRKVGYVPQVDKNDIINFPISVSEMILLNLYSEFNIFNLPKKRHHRVVKDMINIFNLKEFSHKNFNELSGGQKQRVMIAKAMVHNPEILIFDEPTVGVDKDSRKNFYELLNHLHKNHGITILIVTHDSEFTNNFDYRKFILKDRKLTEYVSV